MSPTERVDLEGPVHRGRCDPLPGGVEGYGRHFALVRREDAHRRERRVEEPGLAPDRRGDELSVGRARERGHGLAELHARELAPRRGLEGADEAVRGAHDERSPEPPEPRDVALQVDPLGRRPRRRVVDRDPEAPGRRPGSAPAPREPLAVGAPRDARPPLLALVVREGGDRSVRSGPRWVEGVDVP